MTGCQFEGEELIFPVEVHYRIVCDSGMEVSAHVMVAADELGLADKLVSGNASSSGKYISFHLSTVVHSKEEMNQIDQAFRAVEGVKMVL